jgi:Lon-like protease
VSGADTPEADTPEAATPGTDRPGADRPGADRPHGETRRRHPPRRRAVLARSAFYAASAAVIAWAALVVPMPVIEFVPNAPTSIAPLVAIDGVETTDLDGETALLTVLLRQQPLAPALGAVADGRRSLRPLGEVFPPDVDREQRRLEERERFSRQFDIAAAVAARAAGAEVELVTEVVVIDVLPGSPAHGVLSRGDVVRAVDGAPLASAEELQSLVRGRAVGDELTLTVRHAGQERDVTIELEAFGGSDEPRLGVQIATAVDEVVVPFEVALAPDVRIGGPSAGLMVAITIYDLLSDEDLLAGRSVMGTGSLDADGRVGPVGGVPEKMIAAAEHGADVVFVPALQLEDALTTAPDDLVVIGVDTFEEALEELRRAPG